MKLLSCYVRAFGTLKDTEFNFDDGLNLILCDNGLGKTTLISFIKAMLYGLEYKQNSRNFYERTHFLPWDGSKCGGSLLIEENGRKYRIDRDFGKKQSEDKFVLYDEDKKEPCDDFGEDIGEKLLGVDKTSFERSLFFGQGSLDTAITPSLNAKMGNLSDVRDDMNRFDEAIKSIDKVRLEYEKKTAKNPGKIAQVDARIKECEGCAEQIPILENALRERKKSIDEKKNRIDELFKEKEILSLRIKNAGEFKEKVGALRAKFEQLEKLEKEIDDHEEFFAGKIPEAEALSEMNVKQSSYIEKQSRISEINTRIPSEERVEFLSSVFGGQTPITGETISISQAEAAQIARLRAAGEKTGLSEENEKALLELDKFFENRLTTTDEITGYRQVTEKITEEEARIKVLESSLSEGNLALLEEKGRGSGIYYAMAIFGFLLIITGMLLGVFVTNSTISLTGLLSGLIIGAIFLIVAIIFISQEKALKKRNIKRATANVMELSARIDEGKARVYKDRESCLDFINSFGEGAFGEDTDILGALIEIQRKLDERDRLIKLVNDDKKDTAEHTDALAELTLALYTRLSYVGEKYGYDLYNDHKETELLSELSNDIKEYDEYLINIAQVRDLTSQMKTLKEELDSFMDRYKWEGSKTTEQKLLELKGALEAYNTTKNRIKDLKKEVESVQENEEELEEERLESLQEKLREADEMYEPLVADRTREEEELSRIGNEIEEMEEKARGLTALYEKRAELVDRAGVLADTKKYLEQARDDFLSVYMKPLRDGMNKYVEIFLPEGIMDQMDVSLDMDLSVRLTFRGSIISGEFLSEGYKDIASMCARLALIDVLYKGQNPPFLMDDPFTNLDDKKIKRALDLLGKIGKSTQIIYFTCHESRALPGYKSFDK